MKPMVVGTGELAVVDDKEAAWGDFEEAIRQHIYPLWIVRALFRGVGGEFDGGVTPCRLFRTAVPP